MASTTILHFGDDLCQRIPVMEAAGLMVLQSEISIPAIHTAFDQGDSFSAVIFHCDIVAPPEPAIQEARILSQAPFIFFQNSAVACDESEFNLVIPPLTPPSIWLQKLVELVEDFRVIREESLRLREDCIGVRNKSQALRALSARNRICPIDPDALWNGETGAIPEPKPPEESGPGELRTKAG
ncbi:MAG TPA: hypothetical protein VGR47_14790 [Terracidiphilus sp.]|nr:hypothetical protein [Terracidiphilus sp.]